MDEHSYQEFLGEIWLGCSQCLGYLNTMFLSVWSGPEQFWMFSLNDNGFIDSSTSPAPFLLLRLAMLMLAQYLRQLLKTAYEHLPMLHGLYSFHNSIY